MRKYIFILLAIILLIVANYFYSRRDKQHLVLVNHSKRLVPIGTPILWKGAKVGEIKDVHVVNDTLKYEQGAFVKGLCVGYFTNFQISSGDQPGDLKLEMVNNNIWDPCLNNNDTANIIADSADFSNVQAILDSDKTYSSAKSAMENPEEVNFTQPIDSIRCYCWCMVDKDLIHVIRQNEFRCYTGANISPSELTKYSNYKLTITSKIKLQEFQDLLTTGHIKKFDIGFDARLTFVMYTETRTDTLTLYSHRYIGLGNDRIISFDEDISPDLYKFFDGLNINCKDK